MRKLFVLVAVLIFFATNHLPAQQIRWAANAPLVWSDFKGQPQFDSRYSAATYSYLDYKLRYCTIYSAEATVTGMFSVFRSWKKYMGVGSYVLTHEQTHFDITELYAMKVRQSFARYRSMHKRKFHKEEWLKRVHSRYARELRRYQHKYDRQTNHGNDRDMQQYWNEQIAKEFLELKDFELKP
jgi:hypothetical protein